MSDTRSQTDNDDMLPEYDFSGGVRGKHAQRMRGVSVAKGGAAMSVETRYEHIVLDDANVPLIDGTTMKVVELVTSQQAYGWSAEELHFQFPYLSLGQIHSALAYYWDHKEELDADIERRLAKVDALQQQMPEPALRARLRALRER
jgi:uncharacterized protein (DUF433 family)